MVSLKSQIVQRLLEFFFVHEDEKLYLNEIARRLDLDKRNLSRKLDELESEGVFFAEKTGNLKIYSLNKKFPFYKEYKKIILKTFGIDKKLREVLKMVKGVRRAFIFGSYVSNKTDSQSDIDLFVVGDHNILDMQKVVAELQKEYNREINVINMGTKEFQLKLKEPFVREVLKGKRIELV